jgi:hypothetical protein
MEIGCEDLKLIMSPYEVQSLVPYALSLNTVLLSFHRNPSSANVQNKHVKTGMQMEETDVIGL